MAKIGDLVSKLQIGEKTYKNPEWWNTQHKLKREAKKIEFLNSVKPDFRFSYEAPASRDIPAAAYTRQLLSELDLPAYREFAPWNPVFNKNKSKTIIMYKK